MLWRMLKKMAFKITFTKDEKATFQANLIEEIDKFWAAYEAIPQEEKDRKCVELSGRMGCKNKDVKEFSQFIHEYAWSKRA